MKKIIVDFNLRENSERFSKRFDLEKLGFKRNEENSTILEKEFEDFEDLKLDKLKSKFNLKFQVRNDNDFKRVHIRTPKYAKDNFVKLSILLNEVDDYFDVVLKKIDGTILNYSTDNYTRIHFLTEEEGIKKDICDYRRGKPATVWDTLCHWGFNSSINYVVIDTKIEGKRRVVVIAKFIEE